ncbi:MAG: alpha/beta hydrolase [Planctomycetaceae bacterium]
MEMTHSRRWQTPVVLLLALLSTPVTMAQRPGERPEIAIWDGPVPGPIVPAEPEESQVTGQDGKTRRFNVSRPRVFVYEPAREVPRTGSCVIIVPGGGFGRLSDEHEGKDLGHWFADQGLVAFQLAYRTPTNKQPEPNAGPVMDTQMAVMKIREKAADYGIQPNRIAVLGFSAGGQTALVAATTEVQFDGGEKRLNHRPDLLLLIYPYQVSNPEGTHLRGNIEINEKTPPTFIAQAADDPASKVNGTLLLYSQLISKKVPAELHIYERGGHGYGMRPVKGSPVAEDWPGRAANWLKLREFLSPGSDSSEK